MTGLFASWRDKEADFPVCKLYFINLTLFISNADRFAEPRPDHCLDFRSESIPVVAELGRFVLILLKVVANQAGVEWIFSDLKGKQTHRCARL